MSTIARWFLAESFLVVAVPALAQNFDGPICDQLVGRNYAGVYVAYPSASGQWSLRLVNGSMPYDPAARFFFVPGYGSRLTTSQEDEGVWHVRTRTISRQPQGTDTALVFRPSVTTRCSPNNFLAAFDENARFVALLGYENYHDDNPKRNRSTALHTHFHMRIKDRLSPEADGCTWTDDRAAFPGLSKIYGFETTTDNRTAAALEPINTALAGSPGSRYDGLSSEFAYDRREGTVRPACFGFTIALPTNGLARSWGGGKLMSAQLAGQSWKPTSTEITIKRLRGRTVRVVKSLKVDWNR